MGVSWCRSRRTSSDGSTQAVNICADLFPHRGTDRSRVATRSGPLASLSSARRGSRRSCHRTGLTVSIPAKSFLLPGSRARDGKIPSGTPVALTVFFLKPPARSLWAAYRGMFEKVRVIVAWLRFGRPEKSLSAHLAWSALPSPSVRFSAKIKMFRKGSQM